MILVDAGGLTLNISAKLKQVQTINSWTTLSASTCFACSAKTSVREKTMAGIVHGKNQFCTMKKCTRLEFLKFCHRKVSEICFMSRHQSPAAVWVGGERSSCLTY